MAFCNANLVATSLTTIDASIWRFLSWRPEFVKICVRIGCKKLLMFVPSHKPSLKTPRSARARTLILGGQVQFEYPPFGGL